jgi:general secretion pathway protein G
MKAGPILFYRTPAPRLALDQRPAFWVAVFTVSIVILAVVLPPYILPDYRRGRISTGQSIASMLKGSLQNFEVEFDRYPTTAEGLDALIHAPPALPAWNHAFVEQIPLDPWGRPFQYKCPGVVNPDRFDLTSAGPDGLFGTSDDLDLGALISPPS